MFISLDVSIDVFSNFCCKKGDINEQWNKSNASNGVTNKRQTIHVVCINLDRHVKSVICYSMGWNILGITNGTLIQHVNQVISVKAQKRHTT